MFEKENYVVNESAGALPDTIVVTKGDRTTEQVLEVVVHRSAFSSSSATKGKAFFCVFIFMIFIDQKNGPWARFDVCTV